MDGWLTVEQVRQLENVAIRTIRWRIKENKYHKTRQVKSKKGGRGGVEWEVHISALDPDIQVEALPLVEVTPSLIDTLAPAAKLEAMKILRGEETENLPSLYNRSECPEPVVADWEKKHVDASVLKDDRVRAHAQMVQKALCVPAGWKKRQWVEAVGAEHGMSRASVYRAIKRYQAAGLSGLSHQNKVANKGRAKAWDDDALDWWIGLCLKRAHRKMAKDGLYEILQIEAQKRGWQIGGYQSALWWYRKRVDPRLEAYRDGGLRGLDNILPPVVRDYSDLDPFEILVGDQHRFDLWVMDDVTGEVFRPEGFFWQDLRTRVIYGGAVARKYNSWLVGLALRMGCQIFGAFGSIYTDNGKPELSKYVADLVSGMSALGMAAEAELDLDIDLEDDGIVNPMVETQGHKKAIVKNAKAKMIEGTFNVIEGILRDHFHVPGTVKRLGDADTIQDTDQAEIQRLAEAGKLLTFREFLGVLYSALDHYNKEKPHRGILREWSWIPKPPRATPFDCLQKCMEFGWMPRRLDPADVDLVFLARADRGGRVVTQGRISFKHGPHQLFEADELGPYTGQRVEVRYDPMDPTWTLCFSQSGEFICTARPVEYSSMKDQDLASRKIEEKRHLRKGVVSEYKRLTMSVPEFLATSQDADKPAAIIGRGKTEKLKQIREYTPTPEELIRQEAEADAARARIEAEEAAGKEEREKEIMRGVAELEARMAQEERPFWPTEAARYEWVMMRIHDGKPVEDRDLEWMREYELRMSPADREEWDKFRAATGIK